MALLRHALVFGLLLGTPPALAQSPAPTPAPGAATNADAPRVAGRRIVSTGQTKPPGTGAGALPKPANAGEMAKAQKAAEARSKAWDTKMHHTMGSICHGC